MNDSYRTFVQITVSPETHPDIALIEVGHFENGPQDGTARLEIALRDRDTVVLALGPVAATKLGAALLAASFDHNARLERWDAER